MNILMIHPSFPGQYMYLAPHLAKNPENRVFFLAQENAIERNFEGVKLGLYRKPDEEEQKWIDNLRHLKTLGAAVIGGEQILRSLDYLVKEEKFIPDVVIGHTGWGSLLFVKDKFPTVPVLGLFEWYYRPEKGDSFWWPDEVANLGQRVAIRTKNAHNLLSLDACDMGYCATEWQRQQYPKEYHYKLRTVHEGIDAAFCRPPKKRPGLKLELEDGTKLNIPEGTEIITYVSRGFERFRGFPNFMQAIREVLKLRPKCQVVIAGTDRVCYGEQLPEGQSYKKMEEEKGGYDTKRVHFVGSLNRADYQKMMQSSSCHVYLTRPFILSWSCLEAMSFGLPLVASATPPCEEVVEDNVNGVLANFRSPHHIANKICELLDDREKAERLGKAARETILERYELGKCLRKQEDMMYELLK